MDVITERHKLTNNILCIRVRKGAPVQAIHFITIVQYMPHYTLYHLASPYVLKGQKGIYDISVYLGARW